MEPFKLGNWQVFPKLNQLILESNEKTETVTPKIMMLLNTLKEQNGEPANVEKLIATVWQDRVVADSSVYQAIAQLRKVLAQDEELAVYIERISGQGYRISPDVSISPFEESHSNENNANQSKDKVNSAKENVEPVSRKKIKHVLLLSVLSIFTLVVVLILIFKPSDKKGQSQYFESLTLAKHLIKQTEPASLEHAKQLYLSVLRESPNNTEALNGLCNSYRLLAIYDTLSETERDSLCQPLLQQAFELQPDNANVVASLARLAFEQGHIEQAESLFEQALTITEKNATIWHWFGQLKRSQNDIETALSAHQKAFRLTPNDPIVLRGLAYAYLNNRQLDQARKYFERSIIIAPKFKNRALYELDFYPLDQRRAKAYLNWYQQYKDSYLQRFPVHRLSYVIFLLSINQSELAAQELSKVETLDSIPKHFLLYVKGALAWHNQQPDKALSFLEQRYLLSPGQNHLVMPYLLALLHTGKKTQALILFQQHFNDITELKAIDDEHLGQYLLLASLYKSTANETAYQQAYAKLLRFRQEQPKFPQAYELLWYELIGEQDKLRSHLSQMLNNGWLPDYNDNMFTVSHYLKLIESEKERSSWLKSLQQAQQCIWQNDHCIIDN